MKTIKITATTDAGLMVAKLADKFLGSGAEPKRAAKAEWDRANMAVVAAHGRVSQSEYAALLAARSAARAAYLAAK
jgi:hypothetical protein